MSFSPFKDPLRCRLQATLWLVAFTIGWMWLGRVPFPATEAANGFLWSVALLAAFVWWSPKPIGARYLVRALFVVAVGALLLWSRRSELVGSVHLRNLLAFFFLGLGLWSVMERSSQQVKLPALLLLPGLTIGALYLFLERRHLGQSGLMPTTALHLTLVMAAFFITMLRPDSISAAAVLPFVSVFVVGLLAEAHFSLGVNPWALIYLCAPFVLLWVRGWLPFVPREARIEAAVLGALGALPLIYLCSTQH